MNAYHPHVMVIPEDDANRQIANGFKLEVRHQRRLLVLPEVGGWGHVVDHFLDNQRDEMARFPKRHIVLLLDFDNQTNRRSTIGEKIPVDLKSRVFLLGSRSEPEKLKQAGCGTFEQIGRTLAIECRDGVRALWNDDLLLDNAAELVRLDQAVRPFLFDA